MAKLKLLLLYPLITLIFYNCISTVTGNTLKQYFNKLFNSEPNKIRVKRNEDYNEYYSDDEYYDDYYDDEYYDDEYYYEYYEDEDYPDYKDYQGFNTTDIDGKGFIMNPMEIEARRRRLREKQEKEENFPDEDRKSKKILKKRKKRKKKERKQTDTERKTETEIINELNIEPISKSDWSNATIDEILTIENDDERQIHLDHENPSTADLFEEWKSIDKNFKKKCPTLPDRSVARRPGFSGRCLFPNLTNSTEDFEEIFYDCHGKPFKNGQKWFKAKQNFEGKPGLVAWHVPETDTGYLTWDEANNACANSNMPASSHMWCPNSFIENKYLWHHHPNQPFSPFPKTMGLWTGIFLAIRSGGSIDGKNHWSCQNKYEQTYFNWREGQPDAKMQRWVYTRYMSSKMMDINKNQRGKNYRASTLCEMNCNVMSPCEKLDCEDECVGGVFGEEAYCVCNNEDKIANGNKCVYKLKEFEIPVASERSMIVLLKSAMDPYQHNRNNINKFNDLMSHGCHCVKMNHHTSRLGGASKVDDIDDICKVWGTKRRCLHMLGGKCHELNLDVLSYNITLNAETDEIICSNQSETGPVGDCMRDACIVDKLYAEYVLTAFKTNPSWQPIIGTEETCKKCSNNCIAKTKCRGEAPNLELF